MEKINIVLDIYQSHVFVVVFILKKKIFYISKQKDTIQLTVMPMILLTKD